ncbi:MAG: glutathione ABC transporter permease GsiC, partial [bacterium]
MGSFLARRLALAVPTIFGVLLAVFLLIRLVPGDVVTQMVALEATISPKRVEELRRLFGLDRPLPVQFAEYLGNVAQGDLGRSLRTGLPVGRELLRRFPVTIELAVLGLLAALLLG